MKFVVKDCDPNTGEADDEGYDDEYVVGTLWIILRCIRGWFCLRGDGVL